MKLLIHRYDNSKNRNDHYLVDDLIVVLHQLNYSSISAMLHKFLNR